jgi:hypothetical protein
MVDCLLKQYIISLLSAIDKDMKASILARYSDIDAVSTTDVVRAD